METIGSQQIWTLLYGEDVIQRATNTKIRGDSGHLVTSYLDLAKKVAELQFRNRDYVFLFRGQKKDHKNRQGNTSLRPQIFRDASGERSSGGELRRRFQNLRQSEDMLVERYKQAKFTGLERLKRHRILRWSILQHYEVCPTPLLDVSHSLRVTASFASIDAQGEAFLFVLGVPNISGAITASAEAGIETIRLSSVCPPEAVRPHIQEGYLLSEYPELHDYQQKQHYQNYEIDFGLRLIAKFRFDPDAFWEENDFPMVKYNALYPSHEDDPLLEVTVPIKQVSSY